ncbi:cannabinoid receptor 1-like [Xenia sp. Carnegie-2017]|uniref:cannabinoid receptor 1-like n=1 Tax=Xenia sp. Carnegie-2017 TaxID=2897299 RepID=UPI001F037058|nr:cannabinoid receptor 1-like [Xenia sp. Carnegie-2017]
MRFIVLFILAYLPQPSGNCDARFDLIYERYNCSCSTALEKLPDHCEDLREQVLQKYNDHKKTEQDKTYGSVYMATIPIGSLGILFNTLLILVILCDPLKILHRGAWMTIINLSISDAMASSAKVASSIVAKWWEIEISEKWQIYTNVLWQFGLIGSFFFLTLLTVQSYMIVKYPVKSRFFMTRRRVVFIIGIGWVVSLGLALPEIDDISKNTRIFFVATVSVLELATVIQVFMKIFIIREILAPRETLTSDTRNKKQREVAKTVIILNLILIVTALPYFIAKQIEYITRINDRASGLMVLFSYYYEPVAIVNFVVNPIVYALRLKDYRNSLISLFIRCKNYNHAPFVRVSSKTTTTKV